MLDPSVAFDTNSHFQSPHLNDQINRIYEKLEQVFKNPTAENIDCALEALELISHLPQHIPPSKSYSLFCVVMQASIPEIYSQKKWKASQLTMYGASEEGKFEDVQHILTFLDYHFELITKNDRSQDKPIQHALCALAHTPETIVLKALKQFDPTKPSFVDGIIRVLQYDRPIKLHEATLQFLPLICDKWFNARSPIMNSKQRSRFFMDWASAVDKVEKTPAIQGAALSVLLGMVNSPPWHPHIIPEKWTLLKHFTSVPDNLQHLHGYINNLGLIDEVRNVDNPMAVVLLVEILWLKYAELIPGVKEKLEMVTREIAQNEGGVDLDTSQSYIDKYLSNVGLELKKAESALECYTRQSAEPIAATLREKAGSLQEAMRLLGAIRLGGTI